MFRNFSNFMRISFFPFFFNLVLKLKTLRSSRNFSHENDGYKELCWKFIWWYFLQTITCHHFNLDAIWCIETIQFHIDSFRRILSSHFLKLIIIYFIKCRLICNVQIIFCHSKRYYQTMRRFSKFYCFFFWWVEINFLLQNKWALFERSSIGIEKKSIKAKGGRKYAFLLHQMHQIKSITNKFSYDTIAAKVEHLWHTIDIAQIKIISISWCFKL